MRAHVKEKNLMLDKRYEFLKKLGVGFDSLFEVVDNLNSAYFTEDYPPFNTVKTDDNTYVVQVSMVGYELKDVQASHKDGILTIKAKSEKRPEEHDDVYFHHGIKDGDTYMKFIVSQGLKHEGAVFENGILYVTYKVRKEGDPLVSDGEVEIVDEITAEERLMQVLPHSGRVKFDKFGKPRLRKQRMNFRRYEYDSAGSPIAVMDLDDEKKVDAEETEKLLKGRHKKAEKAAEKAEKKAEKAVEKDEKKVADAAPDKEVTVEVEAPDNKPQIVEAVVVKESEEKVKVELKDATVEVSDKADVLIPVATDKGKADVVVAIKEEEKAILDEAKVDLVETVKEVVDALDSAPALPEKTKKAEDKKTVLVDKEKKDKPTVEVTVPKELTSVVKVEKDPLPSKKEVISIVVEDTSEEIKPEAELLPIVTPEGNPDIIAAIDPEVKTELEDKGVDVKEVVETAVAKAVEEVKTAEPVKEEVVEEASKDPIVEVVEDKADEQKVEVINKDENNKAAIEVKNDLEEPVAIVEIKLDEENLDPVVEGTKPLIVVDATIEVSDDATLHVVKTDEGEADFVIAVPPEVKAEIDKANATVEEIAEVLEAPEVIEAPKMVEDDKGELLEVMPEDVTVMVDKADDTKPTVEVTVPDLVPQVVKAVKVEAEVDKDAPAIKLEDATEDIPADAVIVPIVTPEGQPDMVVAIPAEVAAEVPNAEEVIEKAVNVADVEVDAAPIIDVEELEEASEVKEVVEKLDEIAKEPATIVVDKEAADKPTVEVTLAAEEAPQVVEVKLDPKPSDPLIPAIVVEDATVEVSDDVELIVAKTEEGAADVVIAIEPEVKAELEKADVIVEEVVAKALEINDAQPEVVDVEAALIDAKVEELVDEKLDSDPVVIEEVKKELLEKPLEEVKEELKEVVVEEAIKEVEAHPVEDVTVLVDKADEEKPTVEITMPEVLPQVVKAEIDKEPLSEEIVSIDLVEVEDEIPAEAELIPVVTPDGQPDMVVAVEPEVKAELEKVEAVVEEVLEKAVNIADVVVVPTNSTTLDEIKVDEASAVEEVAEKLEEIAKEPATLVLNETVEDQPVVEVTLAAEEAPQIVEVKLDEKPTAPEVPAIVVEDATETVVSETAELIAVPTEDGKSDVVVVIEPEVKAELEAKDVVVEEVVEKALAVNDAVPEVPVETNLAPMVEVEVKSETTDAVVKVEVPEVLSQIVEVEKEGDVVTLNDTSPEIAPEAELKAVETPEGEADLVIAVEPKVEAELATEGLEVVAVVEEAVKEAKVVVETVVEVAEVEAPAEEVVVAAEPKKPVVVVKKPKTE